MNWTKTIRWAGAILVIVIVALLIGGYAALKSQWLHRYVLAKVIEEGQAATGGRLQVQNWNAHLSPLRFTLYGITLHGSEPGGAKPLFQADQLTVGIRARSLLRRKFQLTELLLQHPVGNVVVNRDGQNNFPTPPPTKSNSTTTVWSLAIGHIVLNNGEIYYNEKKTPLNADLYDLKSEVRFDPSSTRYVGSISYQNGCLQYARYSPLPHNLNAQLSASAQGVSLTSLLLTVGSSKIALRGDMADYNDPKVSASYELNLRGEDFAALSPDTSPAGDVHVIGDMHYQKVGDHSMLRDITMSGEVTSTNLEAASADGRLQVQNLKAQYRLDNGNLDVRNVAADLVNGRLAADLNVQHLDATQHGRIHASVEHLSLSALRQSMKRTDVKRMPVTGTVNAKLKGSWSESIKNLNLIADASLRAAVFSDRTIPKMETPIDGDVHLAYDGKQNAITFHQSTLRIPSTSVVLDGQLSSHSDLRIHATSGDVHQLDELASSLRAAVAESPSQRIATSGEAMLQAVVQGSMQSPRIAGQLYAQNLEVQGSQWKTVRLAFQADPSKFTVQQASLVNAKQGDLTFNGEVGLKRWAYLESSPITVNLSSKGMSIADLEHLANLQYPISGNLSADVSFRGSQLNPSGQGALRLTNGTAYSQPFQNLSARFRAENNSIDSQINVTLPAGGASANIAFTPQTKAYKVDLQSPGIVLQKLQAVQAKNLPLAGTLTATAHGSGTIDNPQLDLLLQIPTLQVRQTAITGMKAQVSVQNQRANLSLSSNVTQAFVRANATVDLTGDYNTQASIDTNKVPLDPFIAVYAPSIPEGFHGETELHATLTGPLKDKSKLEAHLTIPTLSGSYQSLQFANAGPIRADYANSVIVLAPAQIQGTQTSLTFQGRVPLDKRAPMTVQAKGGINLNLLGMFASDLKSAGGIDLDLHGDGSVSDPQLSGKIHINNASLSTSDMPVGLSKFNGTLDLTKDKVQISSLKGEVGSGELSAGGSITYSPSVQFGIALHGKSIRLLYPTGVRTVLDSDLTFTGDMDAANLTGRTLIDSLNFTPDFDLSKFAGQFNGISVPSSGNTLADRIKLAIVLQSTQNLSAQSNQVSLEGTANLQVGGTAAQPVILGRVDLTSGELFFMSNRYELQRGIITFDNPNETHPNLNLQVTSTIQQYNLTLTLNGPIERLSTNYVSDPSLPAADIISLIYRGETTEEAAANGTSTDSMLAGEAASQFSSGLQKLAGISSIQIDPTMGTNNSNLDARIALQQRVTKNFLFSFSTDVSQPEAEIVQGEYQINKRWSVSVTRDEVGGIAVDGRYHTRF